MSRVFDGTTANHLLATNVAGYQTTLGNPVAISVWFKLATTGVLHTLFTKATGSGTCDWYVWVNSDGKIYCSVTDASANMVSTTAITDTSLWHNVIFHTMNITSGTRCYLDGVFDASSSALTIPDVNTYSISVGGPQKFGVTNAQAKIWGPTIWHNAFTSTNASATYTSSTPESIAANCVAAWHLTDSALTDSSPTGNPTSVQGTVAVSTDNPFAAATAATRPVGVVHGGPSNVLIGS